MAEAVIKVGLDHTAVRSGAAEIKAQLNELKNHSAAAGHGGGHGHKFGSMMGEMKAERNIAGLGQELANAHSGAEVLGASLERVGRIVHLGIGIAVATHLAGYFIEAGEKAIEEFEKVGEKIAETAEKAKQAADFGGFTENISALGEVGGALAKVNAQQEDLNHSFSGTRRALWWTGQLESSIEHLAEVKGELEQIGVANRNAAIEDLRFTAQIAELKADGHEKEAAALERERKLKRELLQVEKSSLRGDDKEIAADLLREATASANITRETKERADQEARINALLKERVLLGESEEQRMARLVQEATDLAYSVRILEAAQKERPENDEIPGRLQKLREAMEKTINDVAKLNFATAKHHAAEEARENAQTATKQGQVEDRKFQNAFANMDDEQKVEALLQKRASVAKEWRKAIADKDAGKKADAELEALGLNRQIDDIQRKGEKPEHHKSEIIGSHLARSGMGGIAYAAPGMNDNKRIAKATEDTKSAIEVNTRKLDEVKGELAKLGWAR